MWNEVQGQVLDSDEERKDGWDNAELRICTAPVDDHNNWMLRVEVGSAERTKDVSDSEQIRRVRLLAKRVIGDEETKLSRAEKDKLHID